MATSQPRKGRPRRPEGVKRLKLRESTYNLWIGLKEALGVQGITNSEFAEMLQRAYHGRYSWLLHSRQSGISGFYLPLFQPRTLIQLSYVGQKHLDLRCADLLQSSEK